MFTSNIRMRWINSTCLRIRLLLWHVNIRSVRIRSGSKKYLHEPLQLYYYATMRYYISQMETESMKKKKKKKSSSRRKQKEDGGLEQSPLLQHPRDVSGLTISALVFLRTPMSKDRRPPNWVLTTLTPTRTKSRKADQNGRHAHLLES